MGRHKEINQPAADMPEILPAVVARIEAAQDAALTPSEMDEVLAAGIDLGRLEAMDFIATVANHAAVAIFENVKKSKAWRYLNNSQSCDGRKFESLEEFCSVKLGKSYRRLQELTSTRNLIGQEAFEQAERLGLHQRDYNAIKALPAPDQELIRRAVEEATSREDVLDLLQELAARHAQVKAELTAEVDETKKELAAKVQRLDVVNRQKEAAEEKAARIAVMPPNEALANLQKEATAIMNDALGAVRGGLRQALIALDAQGAGDHVLFMAGLVGQIAADLAALREEFNLPDVSNAADAELAAEVAEWSGA